MADDIEVPAATADAGEPTRLQRIQQFFFNQFHDLEHVAYDTHPLTIWDCEYVMGVLSTKIPTYRGPVSSELFELWASKVVVHEAKKFKITAAILKDYSKIISKAIHVGMGRGAADRAVEHDDLFWQVMFLIFQRAHDLVKKGTAKLSTRLYALAETHVRLYYRNPNNRRHKLNRLRIESGLPYGLKEVLTAQEIASEDAEQPDPQNTGQRRSLRRSL